MDRILFTNGDVLLGSGVALMCTPGHSQRNHSLVVHTDSGVWVSRENVGAAECLVPEESRIPGLKKYAKHTEFEVVLNGNTLEDTARHYNAVVQEKLMTDPSETSTTIRKSFQRTELTPSLLALGTKPSFMHKKVAFGKIHRPKRDQV